MPAFSERLGGGLTDTQIDILVEAMQQRWGHPQAFTSLTLPPFSLDDAIAAGVEPGNLERGKTVYTTYCAHCHGPDGCGGKQGGAVIDEAYLALVSAQALRTAAIAGRLDLGMPDWQKAVADRPMAPQELVDVVAWLTSHRPPLPGRPGRTGTAY